MPPQLLRDYIALHRQGRMTVRVSVLLHWDWPSLSSSAARISDALGYAGMSTGLGHDWLRVGGVKLFADGVPSYRTAWLNEPYPDGSCGALLTPGSDDQQRYDELMEIIEIVHRHRLEVQIHVTGDRAADAAIDGIVRAQQRDPWPNARHALIHGTLLSADAVKRLAEHHIAVITSSLMKSHIGPSMTRSIGPQRWARTFPAGELLKAGVHVADSSDAPVCLPEWGRGVATFLGAASDPYGLLPVQDRLSREQALRLWTTAGAYLERAEHRKGSLAPGMLADIVVLDQDLTSIEDSDFHQLSPAMTVIGGKTVFEAAPRRGTRTESP